MKSKIINDDCLNALKDIKNESIDLVVSDVPYTIIAGGVTIEMETDSTGCVLNRKAVSDGTKCSNKWLKKDSTAIPTAVKSGKMFDNNEIKFSEWLPDVFRVLKNGTHCYLMVNSRNLKELQVESEKAGFVFQNLLVWHKNNATPNKYYMQNAEFILMLRKGKAKNINMLGSKTVISMPNIIGNKKHPTEKPVPLMEHLILNSSSPGDVVMDMFAGSGSVGEACVRNDRKFILIEIDKSFIKVIKDRLSQYV